MIALPIGMPAVLMLFLALGACTAKKEPPKVKPSAPVTVATSVQKDMPVQIRAIGNVEPYTPFRSRPGSTGRYTGSISGKGRT